MSDQNTDQTAPSALDGAKARLATIASDFILRVGRPPRIAIVGMPGSGKSRLFNRLVGAEVSAVSSEGYTTRRAVSGAVEGATFTDTPSLRSGENADADLALEILEADLVIHVINATGRITDRDMALIEKVASRRPVVVALNKVDVLSGRELADIVDASRICLDHLGLAPVPISAKAGTGLDKVLEQLSTRLDKFDPPPEPIPQHEEEPARPTEPENDEPSVMLPLALYSFGAAVGVVLAERSELPVPWIDVLPVALAVYLLVGHIGRMHDQTGPGFHGVRMFATGFGAFGYFLLSGKLAWIAPRIGLILDAFAAFVTTAAVGFVVDRGLDLADRLFPPWLRSFLMGRLKKSKDK